MKGDPGMWWLAALVSNFTASAAWLVVVEKDVSWLIGAAVYSTLMCLLCGMQATNRKDR